MAQRRITVVGAKYVGLTFAWEFSQRRHLTCAFCNAAVSSFGPVDQVRCPSEACRSES
jgi:hypothetical protein